MKPLLEKMTEKTQEALQEAFILAQSKNHPTLEPEHLIQKVLNQPDGIVPQILENMHGVSLWELKESLNKELNRFSKVKEGAPPMLSGKLENLLKFSQKECETLGDSYISTEHLILGVFKTNGSVASLFNRFGVNREAFLMALNHLKRR